MLKIEIVGLRQFICSLLTGLAQPVHLLSLLGCHWQPSRRKENLQFQNVTALRVFGPATHP